MIRCPECQEIQTTDSPFCEHCGFRLRQQATMMEGLPAIRPEQLKRQPEREERRSAGTEVELAAVRPSQRRTAPDDASPITSTSRTSTERELPNVGRRASSDRSGERDTHTAVEGLPAVKLKPTHNVEATGPLQQPASSAAASASSIELAAVRAPMGRWIVFTTIWAIIAASAIMLSVYLRSAGEDRTLAASTEEPTQKIAFAAGSHTFGLDEPTRSFILQTCNRLSDDVDKECEQDRLLAGEFPQRTTALPAYSLDSKEVTQAAYAACVSAGKCDAIQMKDCAVYTVQGLQVGMRVPKSIEAPELPVVCVTHKQAAAYCAFAGGALPTHDQWERAARGPDALLFPWGGSWDPTLANWGEQDIARTLISGKVDGFAWTAPPGAFPEGKSAEGIYDLSGNVAEWVEEDGGVTHTRGGSWASNPFDLRATRHQQLPRDKRRADVGFRCAYN
jgi:formylglycine-generating enzyme required for sulfatase activity